MYRGVASDRFLFLRKILPRIHAHNPDLYQLQFVIFCVSVNVVKPHHGFFLCVKQV